MATLAKPRGYMVDCIFHSEEKKLLTKMYLIVRTEGNALKTIIKSEHPLRNRFDMDWFTPDGPGTVTCSMWLDSKDEADGLAERLKGKALEFGIKLTDNPTIKSIRVEPFREVNLTDEEIEKYRRLG